MEFVTLNEKEFMDFVKTSQTDNFFQTSYMKDRLEKENKACFLVGVKENNKIIAASLIAETGSTFFGKKIYEAYKGFIMDYSNQELLDFMTKKTIEYLKTKNGLRLIIDPYIPNVSRDMDANIIPGIDNQFVKNNLYKLGYKDNNGYQVKWCYCLDINRKTPDELFSSFRSSTKNNINKTLTKYNLVMKTLTKNELPMFKKITSDTCDRREFSDKSLTYYENMYDAFKDKVKFLVCLLDCDKYIDTLKTENKELERKINELSDSAINRSKKETMRKDLENNQTKIKDTEKLKEEKGNEIPLSGAMFMLYGKEIVYLFSGSYKEYMKFCGQYRLQWEIIKYAAENNYQRYNFYGIQDVFNPDGKDRGVYEFKKGFGGYVEELLGSFRIDISPLGKIYDLLKKIKSIIKK